MEVMFVCVLIVVIEISGNVDFVEYDVIGVFVLVGD